MSAVHPAAVVKFKAPFQKKKNDKLNTLYNALTTEGLSDKEAAKVAKTAYKMEQFGLAPDRALKAAKINQALVDDGVDSGKAEEISRMSVNGGTGSVADAKAVGKAIAIFPKKMLETMRKNGTDLVACRGSVTDHCANLRGVTPRGWPDTMTWDSVPGLGPAATGTANEVVIATKDDGGERKVPGKGDGHGAFDLVGHEAGHGFDLRSNPPKNQDKDFRKARKADIDAAKLKGTRDGGPESANYFLTVAEGGSQATDDAAIQETFAESCGRFYGGDTSLKTEWPALYKFWNGKPFG